MKQPRALRWLRLDNAAKIYPAARRKHWSNLFRQSVTLTEAVDREILSRALNVTVPRFPGIAARLRRGMFWYYLQELAHGPELSEECSYPLRCMSREEVRRCAFRVIVYRERIAVEFFHALTDGNGALVFLKTLTAEYLEQKYGITIPAEAGVLDRREPPREEELEDSFLRYAGPVSARRGGRKAWQPRGTALPGGALRLCCFRLPLEESLALARRYGVTLTVLLSAALMQALLRLQAETAPRRAGCRPVKLLIPVNLRQLFPSSTLRNFVLYTIPELDPRLGDYSFEEICSIIRHKMGLEVRAKHMSRMIATNVGNERSTLLRLVPLPLKDLVMKAVFERVGERQACLSLSNLGAVTLPEAMRPYIRRFDFILGAQAAAPHNCAVLSWDDTVYVNFTRNIREPELERQFWLVLRELGLPATAESNED